MNRLASIAVSLRSFNPIIRTPFVIEGASHLFLERFGLPFLTIPSSLELENSAEWACWTKSQREELTTRLSKAILQSWKPQLVVYDCLPSLHFSTEVRRNRIRSAFCVRQVKNFEAYANDPRVGPAISDAQVLIVPHSAATFPLPKHLLHKTVYVGDIVSPTAISGPKSTRDLAEGQRMVIITGGGGGHVRTVEFYNLVVNALRTIMAGRDDLYVLLVTGPLFRGWDRLLPTDKIHVSPYEPELSSLFSGSALVISQAGYNSMVELATLGVTTICIPQTRAFDDQFERAMVFSQRNENFSVFQGGESEKLASLICECLKKSTVRKVAVSSRAVYGAQLAGEVLMQLLEH